MKNKLLFIALLFFATSVVFAQKNQATLVSSNDKETVVKFTLNDFDFYEVQTNKGTAKHITAKGLSSLLQKGSPDILKFSKSIIISDAYQNEIEIVSSKFTELQDIMLAPSKGNLLRTVDPTCVFS